MILPAIGAIVGATMGFKGLAGFTGFFAILSLLMTLSEVAEHGFSDSYTINGHRPFVEPMVAFLTLTAISVILFIL